MLIIIPQSGCCSTRTGVSHLLVYCCLNVPICCDISAMLRAMASLDFIILHIASRKIIQPITMISITIHIHHQLAPPYPIISFTFFPNFFCKLLFSPAIFISFHGLSGRHEMGQIPQLLVANDPFISLCYRLTNYNWNPFIFCLRSMGSLLKSPTTLFRLTPAYCLVISMASSIISTKFTIRN